MAKLLALLLVLSSCGSIEGHSQTHLRFFDARVVPFYEKFLNYAKLYMGDKKYSELSAVPLNARIANIHENNPTLLGTCSFEDGVLKVSIDDRVYVYESLTFIEIVAFHEFGHCLLFRDHNNEHNAAGIRSSIMNEHAISEYEYTENKEYYLNELFNGSNFGVRP